MQATYTPRGLSLVVNTLQLSQLHRGTRLTADISDGIPPRADFFVQRDRRFLSAVSQRPEIVVVTLGTKLHEECASKLLIELESEVPIARSDNFEVTLSVQRDFNRFQGLELMEYITGSRKEVPDFLQPNTRKYVR